MLKNNYSCYHHVAAGNYITLAVNLTGGLLLRWYRDTLCDKEREKAHQEGRSPYEVIIREASEQLKSIYFLPHFVGSGTPSFDPYSRGAIVGLTNETSKEDISRALLNSIIFESKTDLNLLKQGGFAINDLRAVGGGSRSDRWLQMKADCLGLPVNRMAVTEAAALGAAILAGIATGEYSNCREGIESCVKTDREFIPRGDQQTLYQEKYEEFIRLYPALLAFNHRITKS
jgi:xylulokinase